MPPPPQRTWHSGAVCSAHSVTQIGTWRWNHCWSEAPSLEMFDSPTFGYATFWFGPRWYSLGYGWIDHAVNGSFGFASETRRANVAGAVESWIPARWTLAPRLDVSPAATWARGLPALIPLYAAM